MLNNDKYYIAFAHNRFVQISKQEHERLRLVRNEPLVDATPEQQAECVWIDDPSMDD